MGYSFPGLLGFGLVIGGFAGVAGEILAAGVMAWQGVQLVTVPLMGVTAGSPRLTIFVTIVAVVLVRMKAVPRGITGYVVGKTFYQCVANMLCFLVSLAVGALALGGLVPSEPLRWLAAFGWCALGLVCSIPIGAVIGCLISSSVALVIPIVFLYGLMIISGIFSPVVGMAGWVQAIAKAFPVYWLGLGMRSAFLPGQAVALEAGEE